MYNHRLYIIIRNNLITFRKKFIRSNYNEVYNTRSYVGYNYKYVYIYRKIY